MADYEDSQALVRRMAQCTVKLHELSGPVGKARQIKEFSSDMRKNALAAEMIKAVRAGKSGVVAETEARASESYKKTLDVLADQYADAEKTLAEWTATQARFDAARSLLSFNKETIRNLDAA